jgi:hypothetical protein
VRSAALHRHPVGSTENRWSLRRRALREHVTASADYQRTLLAFGKAFFPPPPGSFAARTHDDGSIRLEAVR